MSFFPGHEETLPPNSRAPFFLYYILGRGKQGHVDLQSFSNSQLASSSAQNCTVSCWNKCDSSFLLHRRSFLRFHVVARTYFFFFFFLQWWEQPSTVASFSTCTVVSFDELSFATGGNGKKRDKYLCWHFDRFLCVSAAILNKLSTWVGLFDAGHYCLDMLMTWKTLRALSLFILVLLCFDVIVILIYSQH